MEITKKVYMKDRDEWRSWLEKNHSTEKEIWLVFYKKHTNKPTVLYSEAVEEALCFGWIDSTLKRIDDEKHAQKFSPRKDNKNWSELNRTRVEMLIKSGRMTKAGMDKFNFIPNDKPQMTRKDFANELCGEFLEALKQNKPAKKFFDSLAPTYQKQFNLWINTAKREETKLNRIKEAVGLLAQSKKLGLK